MYIDEIEDIILKHNLKTQLYDIQLYTSFSNDNTDTTKVQFENCLSDIHD